MFSLPTIWDGSAKIDEKLEASLDEVRWGLYVGWVTSTGQNVVAFSIDNILAEPYTST